MPARDTVRAAERPVARLLGPPRLAAAVLLAALAGVASAQQPSDDYLAGYAAAVLARELGIADAQVAARAGVLTVPRSQLGDRDPVRVEQVLANLPGVVRVVLADEDAPPPPPAGQAAPPAAGPSFLSRTALLFEPLHADPRWPHFSATWQDYRRGDGLDDVAATTFGESFSLLRRRWGEASEVELGVQAGVFSIFDLDADSLDLVNADYFVGPALSWRAEPFTALLRLYHQSSHLGDEYLLRARPARVNLSYEVVDALVAVDAAEPVRLYAGGGYVVHTDTPLERWLAQGGAEWFGAPFGGSGLRPLIACDVQAREQSDWRGDVSVRAGVELADPAAGGGRMQVLLEYYRGRSPNGQFYEQRIELLGLGLHLYF